MFNESLLHNLTPDELERYDLIPDYLLGAIEDAKESGYQNGFEQGSEDADRHASEEVCEAITEFESEVLLMLSELCELLETDEQKDHAEIFRKDIIRLAARLK
jgi:flagellar biosynthesis/type III secretory pathway protein FliH